MQRGDVRLKPVWPVNTRLTDEFLSATPADTDKMAAAIDLLVQDDMTQGGGLYSVCLSGRAPGRVIAFTSLPPEAAYEMALMGMTSSSDGDGGRERLSSDG